MRAKEVEGWSTVRRARNAEASAPEENKVNKQETTGVS